jgi:mannose-1-phosphate guanylyltransferase
MIVPVILAGGSGKRLWPLSRKLYPKQFINLVNETSLFQDTLLRIPENFLKPIIVCNEEHRFIVAEQLRQININPNCIILEPEGKNTAPAITLASLKMTKDNDHSVILVLSADHLIEDTKKFHKSISIALDLAKTGKLVTFGVKPTSADTGYGYIEVESNNITNYSKIKSFKEKPDNHTAQAYLDSGNYLWNSGMFMFQTSKFLNELDNFEPKILNACKKSLEKFTIDSDFLRIDHSEFKKCPNSSVDFAVMEKTSEGVVIPLNTKWSDVGSWPSLWDIKPKDHNNNVCEGDIIIENSNDSYIYSENRLVSAVGVSELVIIDTQDALLVASKKHIKSIEKIHEKLSRDDRVELTNHRKVFRPWGYYDLIDKGEGFQVKRILVNSHSKLSLQKHNYRSEHWVVVRGTATVTCGDEIFLLQENQSTYIPIGTQHRLSNNHGIALEIIEIQTGIYLGEDDIVRLEDEYKRN